MKEGRFILPGYKIQAGTVPSARGCSLGTYGGPGTSNREPAGIAESAINKTGHLDIVTLRGSAPENSGCVVSDSPR